MLLRLFDAIADFFRLVLVADYAKLFRELFNRLCHEVDYNLLQNRTENRTQRTERQLCNQADEICRLCRNAFE